VANYIPSEAAIRRIVKIEVRTTRARIQFVDFGMDDAVQSEDEGAYRWGASKNAG
jgi:hypothetical protein